MRRSLEVAATIVIFGAAVWAFVLWVAGPYRCNLTTRKATRRLLFAISLPDKSLRAARLARINVDELEPCVAASPANIPAAMDLAGSYRSLGMLAKAASTYQTALSYDRRPELYFNLGQTLLAMGQKQAGIQNLITACLYDPVYYDEISQEQQEVKSAVRAYLVAHTRRY